MQVVIELPEPLAQRFTSEAKVRRTSVEQLLVESASAFMQEAGRAPSGLSADSKSPVSHLDRNLNDVGLATEQELEDPNYWESLPKLHP